MRGSRFGKRSGMAQLPSQSQFGDYGDWPGRDVLDSGGERLGGVREIYLDRETGHPEWVLVDLDGDQARFVPLADAEVGSTTIRVAHSASQIKDAPGIGAESQIDQTEERRLYAHYGIGYSEDDSGSGLPSDGPPPTDDRSETAAPPPAPESVPPWRREEPSDVQPSGWGQTESTPPPSPGDEGSDEPAAVSMDS